MTKARGPAPPWSRILLKERFGLDAALEPLPIGATLDDTQADAVLLIGDRAIHSPAGRFAEVWDLGDEWCRWAELPFVFAMWTARAASIWMGWKRRLAKPATWASPTFQRSPRGSGPARADRAAMHAYLRDHLYFYLGPRERQGLKLFYDRSGGDGSRTDWSNLLRRISK